MSTVAKRKKPLGASILGGFLGLLSGVGIGIYLQQAGMISPTTKLGLLVPLVGLILGFCAGIFGGRRGRG